MGLVGIAVQPGKHSCIVNFHIRDPAGDRNPGGMKGERAVRVIADHYHLEFRPHFFQTVDTRAEVFVFTGKVDGIVLAKPLS